MLEWEQNEFLANLCVGETYTTRITRHFIGSHARRMKFGQRIELERK